MRSVGLQGSQQLPDISRPRRCQVVLSYAPTPQPAPRQWQQQQQQQQQLHQPHPPSEHQQYQQLDPQQPLWPSQLHHHHHHQQHHQQHHQHQHQQLHPGQPPGSSSSPTPQFAAPPHRPHRQCRSASLARALLVSVGRAQAMLVAYPALCNYNHTLLARKLQALADMMQVEPQRLAAALSGVPKVYGCSLQEVERRLMGLAWIQPDTQQLTELVLQCPLLLTWSAHQLRARLTSMASQLGLSINSLAGLLQQHPQLLPASSHLRRTLQLLQQLFMLAAGSEQAGFGTGVVSAMVAAAQQGTGQPGGLDGRSPYQQQQQQGGGGSAVDAAEAAARRFAVAHPQVLLAGPEALQARVVAMQARSGLSAAQVAAMLLSQPALLLDGPPIVGPGSVSQAGGDRQAPQEAEMHSPYNQQRRRGNKRQR